MSRSLLVASLPGEFRAAIVEGARLVEFRLVRTVGASHVGEIYLGRVVRLLPALRAALVEIGLERPAFLSADDCLPRRDLAGLHEGAAIPVQVTRDQRADKAARVAMRIRLAGRLMAWTPGRPGVAAPDRRAAKRIGLVSSWLNPGESVRLLPEASSAADDALAADLAELRARWAALEARSLAAEPPHCLEAVPPLAGLLAELADPALDAVIVDDAAVHAEIRGWLARERAALVALLAHHRGPLPLFEAHGIAEAVAGLFDFHVPLAGGGALTIEPLATATFIDVDSGALAEEPRTGEEALLSADLAAAAEIAHQIRLRSLGGAIIVDFIALRRTDARARLVAALQRSLEAEAGDSQVIGWTRLGHMEVIRPRRRVPLHDLVFERAGRGGLVKTPLTVALEALAAASRQAAAAPARLLALRLHPSAASVLEGEAALARKALEGRLGQALAIVAEPGFPRETFDIGPI